MALTFKALLRHIIHYKRRPGKEEHSIYMNELPGHLNILYMSNTDPIHLYCSKSHYTSVYMLCAPFIKEEKCNNVAWVKLIKFKALSKTHKEATFDP